MDGQGHSLGDALVRVQAMEVRRTQNQSVGNGLGFNLRELCLHHMPCPICRRMRREFQLGPRWSELGEMSENERRTWSEAREQEED